MKWVPEVQRPGCEADHSPASSTEVKNEWRCTSTPPICLHGTYREFIYTFFNVLPGTNLQFITLRLWEIRYRLTTARFATVVQDPVNIAPPV
jgi:hypothetical protein